MPSNQREAAGLDLSNPSGITQEELEAFRQAYANSNKGQIRSYEFWLEFRPDVLKRHKARSVHWYVGGDHVLSTLSALHQYAVVGFRDGLKYELRLAESRGVPLGDVLDLLSIAFIHAGHPGMYAVADELSEPLRAYEADADAGPCYPENFRFDPDAFVSGMDFSTLEASARDVESLKVWYVETAGEIPRHVEFMAKFRPDLLKAYRNRYEHAIHSSLPAQVMPFVQLHYNIYRGFEEGIRENVLLARALGMTKTQVLDAIFCAVLHSGANGLDAVSRSAEELIETFPVDGA